MDAKRMKTQVRMFIILAIIFAITFQFGVWLINKLAYTAIREGITIGEKLSHE